MSENQAVRAGATRRNVINPYGQAPVYSGHLSYNALNRYARYAEAVGPADDDEIVDAMASNELTPTVSTNENVRFWKPGEETRNGETYPQDVAYDRSAWLEDDYVRQFTSESERGESAECNSSAPVQRS